MMTLVAFCFFCLLTLGASGEQVLDRDAAIAVPFAGTTMPFVDFLVVGPLVLAGIYAYLHVFVEYRWRLERAAEGKGWSETSARSPYLFNLDMPSAKVLSEFLLYWLGPAVPARFWIKGIPGRRRGTWFSMSS